MGGWDTHILTNSFTHILVNLVCLVCLVTAKRLIDSIAFVYNVVPVSQQSVLSLYPLTYILHHTSSIPYSQSLCHPPSYIVHHTSLILLALLPFLHYARDSLKCSFSAEFLEICPRLHKFLFTIPLITFLKQR